MLTTLEQGVKGEKWFRLFDKVFAERNLWVAFQQVAKNDGAAGVDHVSVQEFEKRLVEGQIRRIELDAVRDLPLQIGLAAGEPDRQQKKIEEIAPKQSEAGIQQHVSVDERAIEINEQRRFGCYGWRRYGPRALAGFTVAHAIPLLSPLGEPGPGSCPIYGAARLAVRSIVSRSVNHSLEYSQSR